MTSPRGCGIDSPEGTVSCDTRLLADADTVLPASGRHSTQHTIEGLSTERTRVRYSIAIVSVIGFAIGLYALFGFTLELESTVLAAAGGESVTLYGLATNGWVDTYALAFWILLACVILGLLAPMGLACGVLIFAMGVDGIMVDVPTGLGLVEMTAVNSTSLAVIGIVMVAVAIAHLYLLDRYARLKRYA